MGAADRAYRGKADFRHAEHVELDASLAILNPARIDLDIVILLVYMVYKMDAIDLSLPSPHRLFASEWH